MGLVYPFAELSLAFFAFFVPTLTYFVTIAVFAFGAAGVISALRRGLDMDCPCMATFLPCRSRPSR